MCDFLRKFLESIGENPSREGLVRTPERWESAIRELTSGYDKTIEDAVGGGVFETEFDDAVIVRDIDFSSLCEHHMLPFFGKIHISYVPDRRIIGLSKIPRIIEALSRRLQTQERLGRHICNALAETLDPKGVAVIIEATHLCMKLRGPKTEARVITQHQNGHSGQNALRALQ